MSLLATANLDDGVTVAFGFFALTLLLAFAWGLLFGFVAFVKRMLG